MAAASKFSRMPGVSASSVPSSALTRWRRVLGCEPHRLQGRIGAPISAA
jgi:hypothetical protein